MEDEMEEELKEIDDVKDVQFIDLKTGEVLLEFDALKVSTIVREEEKDEEDT